MIRYLYSLYRVGFIIKVVGYFSNFKSKGIFLDLKKCLDNSIYLFTLFHLYGIVNGIFLDFRGYISLLNLYLFTINFNASNKLRLAVEYLILEASLLHLILYYPWEGLIYGYIHVF